MSVATPIRIWKYLSTLWGALSIGAVLFPGSAVLLGADVAPSHSLLKTYYAFVPSVLAAFTLLLLTSMRDELSDLAKARRWATRSFISAIVILFAFVAVRQTLVEITQIEPMVFSGTQSTQVMRAQGIVKVTTRDSAGVVLADLERGDVWDVATLALLSCAFGLLTLAFGSLGLNEYARRAT